MIKWIIASLNIAVMLVIFLNMDVLINWIDAKENNDFIVVFVLTVGLAAVPGIPFGLVGALIGAKYGLLWGSVMNITASTLAAAFVYFLFRYLLNSLGTALVKRNTSFRRMHEFIKHHTFWALLIARIIPVMPAALINSYAGVFGLPFKIFILSTLLGKIPVMLVFAYVGSNIRSGSTAWMIVVVIYSLFLLMVYAVYQLYYIRK
ncbi:VTT domain-containing protein [Paenibacillus sp. LHD-38]|uniref:TVP38/TMEM64 family protein n=1 Tax=Paenibacillus sp. LHD-38 TaxID=3072143 RepID=UPI00280DA8DE|nr:VTT domain-containing protein [Paenibacillus sp. LHD-38]MDQ8739050.1 VTT domain-containing protein [Paenibacillus sp. LHD-38]